MSNNIKLQRQAEKIAKRLAKEAEQPEELWELFLIEAYQELSKKELRK